MGHARALLPLNGDNVTTIKDWFNKKFRLV